MLYLRVVFWFVLSNIGPAVLKQYEKRRYVSWKQIDFYTSSLVIRDVILGLPTQPVALCLDSNAGSSFPSNLTKILHEAGIKTSLYMVSAEKDVKHVKNDVKLWLSQYKTANFLFFLRRHLMEKVLAEISEANLVHRNIIYLFFWIKAEVTASFRVHLHETMKVAVITNPRPEFYQIYYTQANSKGHKQLSLVNWWTSKTGIFRYPMLPPTLKVYNSFHGRLFIIPVLHKPPWFFVNYFNESYMEVEGGRDVKLLSFIADKLNFRCEYIDPPDRNQGSSIVNGTMQGAIGLVASREADLFVGDLTVTYERSQAVEFSFLTLVDSELFLTHSPGLLNEALALIRPFHWIVWPALLITLLLSGPILFLFINASYNANHIHRKKTKVFGDCVWITCTIFLQQAVRFRSDNHKVRFIIVLFSLSLTYVIGDMYSASLTSLFARPSRERPISTLEELMEAMKNEQYQLLVEENSASHSNLENGTGIYKSIWLVMTQQKEIFIETTEMGMKLIRDRKKYAIIGGRETFYYDTHRFGAENFHLSQKLSTRYSAIAFQIGCPYLEIFDSVLMRLFEAGIYSKITEEEYQKLYQKRAGATDNKIVSEGANEVEESDNHLKPMSMKTLQGAFYILIIGYMISVLAFLDECYCNNKQKQIQQKLINKWNFIPRIANLITFVVPPSSDQNVKPYFRGGSRRRFY